jgi:hypothetical protein
VFRRRRSLYYIGEEWNRGPTEVLSKLGNPLRGWWVIMYYAYILRWNWLAKAIPGLGPEA